MTRLTLWFGMVMTGWVTIASLGWLLDLVLWQVSRDYIYGPHEFLHQGVRIGPAIGAFLAAVATVQDWPLPSRQGLRKSFGILWCCPIVLAIGLAAVLAIMSQFLTTVQTFERLLPVRREAFCTGLTYGGAIGLAVGVACVTRMILIDRSSGGRAAPKIARG